MLRERACFPRRCACTLSAPRSELPPESGQISAWVAGGAARSWAGLEAGLVYGEAEPVAADELVVGGAALEMLGDHVDVLEVALDQVAVVGCGRAREAVDALDDLRGESDAVCGGEAEGRAALEGDLAGGGLVPDVGDGFHEEGAA